MEEIVQDWNDLTMTYTNGALWFLINQEKITCCKFTFDSYVAKEFSTTPTSRIFLLQVQLLFCFLFAIFQSKCMKVVRVQECLKKQKIIVLKASFFQIEKNTFSKFVTHPMCIEFFFYVPGKFLFVNIYVSECNRPLVPCSFYKKLSLFLTVSHRIKYYSYLVISRFEPYLKNKYQCQKKLYIKAISNYCVTVWKIIKNSIYTSLSITKNSKLLVCFNQDFNNQTLAKIVETINEPTVNKDITCYIFDNEYNQKEEFLKLVDEVHNIKIIYRSLKSQFFSHIYYNSVEQARKKKEKLLISFVQATIISQTSKTQQNQMLMLLKMLLFYKRTSLNENNSKKSNQLKILKKQTCQIKKESKMGKHNNHLNEKFRKNFNYQKKINGEI
ncbi:hypothetical protein RFI_19391 [Reticulomyxa filosa]|uniref:Uncharacterized protein n=1 Tax=Reticulomyxa filosa TaxID=46433 RepID=X6MWS9_RETFI|nr:hypothetical protein RFI_19391 [Reticulomyxa filosa]|eukprot:ETO17917.1 hypothetical protein RFI_19391 [Reticulomyxa filosa]